MPSGLKTGVHYNPQGTGRFPRRRAAQPYHRAGPVGGVDHGSQGTGPARRHPADRQVHPHGVEDQAEALVSPPRTKASAHSDRLHIACIPGDVGSREVSADGSELVEEAGPENDETPSGEGVSSFPVTDFQEESVDVSSGGGGNCTRVPRSVGEGLYARSRFFDCRPGSPNRQGLFRLSSP